MIPGVPGPAMNEWFARFPGEIELREDTYLLYPWRSDLSVKVRDSRSLDVKSYLGTADALRAPVDGCMERWRKWSFPCAPRVWEAPSPAGWLTVRKRRRTSRFHLSADQDGAKRSGRARASCAVELASVEVRGELWWSVGFEATGAAEMLRDALQGAADAMFAQAMPAGIKLGLDNSLSYASWLSRWSADHNS